MKKIVNRILDKFGLEIRRKQKDIHIVQRASMRGSLTEGIKNGLAPETVIDVGVAQGTPELYELFPKARHILIEPLEEFLPSLKRISARLDKAEYIMAVAASKSGRITINVHPDLVGSSIYKEREDSAVNGFEREVNSVTLDEVCREKRTHGPYLIKIDTQGSELDVLKGAENILKDTEFIIIESSFFKFFEGGASLEECILFMKHMGFLAYDIFDLSYRPLDGAMSQVNIAFVKEKSKFRKHHFYSTIKQRDEQTRRLLETLRREI